jgi:Kef-type K+ transport system membrane component KefB
MGINNLSNLIDAHNWFFNVQAGNKILYITALLVFLALLIVLITKRYRIPIVVGYVFLGILLSEDIINTLPFLSDIQIEWYLFVVDSFGYLTHIALGFIAFRIGSELTIKLFKRLGKDILVIVIIQTIAAFGLVTLAIYFIGQPIYISMLLGAIAAATAPAATVMVLREYNSKGPLTSVIMAVVGIDDALALIIFSIIEPISLIIHSGKAKLTIIKTIGIPLIEITGSLIIGVIIGYLTQYFLIKFKNRTKKILTLISAIIGASAIAIYTGHSPLITNMAVGFACKNFTDQNLEISDYLEIITVPLYAMFFILAGTEIKFTGLKPGFSLITITYITARIIGKVGGASSAAYLVQAPKKIRKYIGLNLLPQSGVAIAMAYTIQNKFSTSTSTLIFNVLLFTTAFTEIIGPLATKYSISKAGEIEKEEN